jgi:methylenetetrahydrofolate--tRNA-(uracil-5-)-methyltransferase
VEVTVIGGGLAGCEAAWQLARRGVDVRLLEMRPGHGGGAHVGGGLAELVCSNSLRGAALSGAVGLLKEELRRLGSLLIRCADATAVPAGRALAVDRERFSRAVEEALSGHPRISVLRERAPSIPGGRSVVATGPLTEGPLLAELERLCPSLHYHDAIAPLVAAESIDMSVAFLADRYEQAGEGAAYLNCPLDEAGYLRFVAELAGADKTPLRDFETAPFFEGCLPVEEMAARGPLTLAHGPLKPVGLTDPATGRRPFAVVQLRPEDEGRTAYNLVGFQTRLTRPEQRRVFRLIPGLARAEFERFGQVHRNVFVDAPRVLDPLMRLGARPEVTLAGQITGVEGYVESIASGLLAGIFVAAELEGRPLEPPPPTTAVGGLARHVSTPVAAYQPSNVVWAMIQAPPRTRREGKRDHRLACARRALEDLDGWAARSGAGVFHDQPTG